MRNLGSRNSWCDSLVVGRKYSSDLLRTQGLAIDPVTSNLYVCDGILVGIKVFSSNFDLLFTFTTKTLRKAHGICISHDKVFVTFMYTSVISVFTLEGDIISRFSFKTPCFSTTSGGVAVDNDGDIYICDDVLSKLFVLTHDGCRNHCFARSSVKYPRDVKFYQDNVIVLGASSLSDNTIEIRVYSKMEELLTAIQVEGLFGVKFFDVTPNSNYVISSINHVVYVSKNGQVLKTFGSYNISMQHTYQAGIVLDNKSMEIVGLHLFEGYDCPLSFYTYPIIDSTYAYV